MITYLTKTELKEREGWTDAAIKRFLGEEDKRVKHTSYPFNRFGTLVCLYSISRVQQAEATEEFALWKSASQKRREAAKKASETRKERERQRTIEAHERAQEQQRQQQMFTQALSLMKLNIVPLPHKELVAKAIAEWSLNNPDIKPIAPIKTEVIKTSEILAGLRGYGSKKIPQIISKTYEFLSKYYTRLDEGKEHELKKSTQEFYALCQEYCQLFKSLNQNEHYKNIFSKLNLILELDTAKKFSIQTSVEEMCSWLVNAVEALDDKAEKIIVKHEGIKVIRLEDILIQEILKIHTTELLAFENELNSLVESFQEWFPMAAISAKKRYYQSIREQYPYFSAKES